MGILIVNSIMHYVESEFPDPEHYETEGVQHYRPVNDPQRNFLPSKLENPEKEDITSHFRSPRQLPRMLDLLLDVRTVVKQDCYIQNLN